MIARIQFGTAVLAETVRACDRDALELNRLDGSDAIPLRTVVTTDGHPAQLQPAFDGDDSVNRVDVIESPDGRHSYLAVHGENSQAESVYQSLVAHCGVFVSGTIRDGVWELCVRFPDRESFEAFRDDCPAEEAKLDVQAVYKTHVSVRTKRCPLTEQQAELIRLAARGGYFEVPREQSLGELATELDISTQAASERLRRGMDSLIDETLPREE
jgi:predicted DNA binding protein